MLEYIETSVVRDDVLFVPLSSLSALRTYCALHSPCTVATEGMLCQVHKPGTVGTRLYRSASTCVCLLWGVLRAAKAKHI